jgi:hypothetical protein
VSSGGGNGGRRRWLTVVAILLFIVAIGAGVGALMLGGSNGGGGGGEDSDEKTAFENYEKYLVDNESLEFDDESLNTLKKLHDNFIDKTDMDMSEYNKVFDFFMTFSKYSLPTRDELYGKYYADGAESASEYLDTIVKQYENYTDIYGYDYHDLISSWSRIIVELAELYNKAGCLNEEGADYDCVVANYTAENKQLMSDMSVVDVRMSTIQEGVKRYLLTETLSLMDSFEGEQDDDSE